MKDQLFQFKVSLQDALPLVERRFVIDRDITFKRFHKILQAVLGWENYHMYSFVFDKFRIVDTAMDAYYFGEYSAYSNEVELVELLKRVNQQFLYIYDLQNDWRHHIVFEQRLPVSKYPVFPICIAGTGDCPPEDCGGSAAYNDLPLEKKVGNPFALELINQKLRRLDE